MRVPGWIVGGMAALLLGACAGGTEVGRATAVQPFDIDALAEMSKTPAGLRAYMSGRTTRSYDTGHGTQVAYTAPSGESFLWYPGNRQILKGEWEIRDAEPAPLLCFRYGRDTYNPSTRRRGGDWNCAPGGLFVALDRERLDGDPFGLASGDLPFVLKADDVPVGELAARLGIPPPAMRYLRVARLPPPGP